jgi:hypothetical protein
MAPGGAVRAQLAGGLIALLGASGTLVCCVLPAVMVSLGLGATLAAWVSAVPQLIWLSQHKALVFGLAGGILLLAGGLHAWARRQPCPADPALARACSRGRRIGRWLLGIAIAAYLLGALFAFGLA